MTRWLVLVACACQSNPAPPQDPPPPAPTPATAVDAAIAKPARTPSPVLVGVELPRTTSSCAKPALDDCALPNVTRDAQARPSTLPDCTLAESVELREIDRFSKRGLLVLRHGKDVVTADVLSAFATWDPVTTKYKPRLRLVRAACVDDVADIAIGTGEATTIHIQCRPKACVRDTELTAGGAKLAALLADVKRVTERHDWAALLELCSAEHRRSQMGEMHQDRNTYLAEILGVHADGNSLNDDRITLADLNTLGAITWVETTKVNDGFTAVGLIARKDAAPLRVELTIVSASNKLWLAGGVG